MCTYAFVRTYGFVCVCVCVCVRDERCVDPCIVLYFKCRDRTVIVVALKGTHGFSRDEAQSINKCILTTESYFTSLDFDPIRRCTIRFVLPLGSQNRQQSLNPDALHSRRPVTQGS